MFSAHGASLVESSLFSSRRQGECAAGQKSPDIEWGKGDGCIEIAANRQALPSSKTLSPPLKTFWKTEQKQ